MEKEKTGLINRPDAWGLLKSVGNAVSDEQFRDDVARQAKKLVLMPEKSPYGAGGIPSEDELAAMSWVDLLELRSKLKTTAEQNAVAPFEHRAYARENSSNAYGALQNAVGSLGYTPLKAITGGSRSDPSLSEIGQGLHGVWEGLTK